MVCITGVNIQMPASLHQLLQSGGKRTPNTLTGWKVDILKVSMADSSTAKQQTVKQKGIPTELNQSSGSCGGH